MQICKKMTFFFFNNAFFDPVQLKKKVYDQIFLIKYLLNIQLSLKKIVSY